MASDRSSLSTTRNSTSDGSTATSSNEGSHKSNSGADECVQNALTVDVEAMEKLTSLNRGGSHSTESDVAAVAPDNPAKPAAVVPCDARKPSLATAERVAENPLQATVEGGTKTANAGAAKPATNKQSRSVLGLPVRSMVLVGILVVIIVAAFAYAIAFRAGRVLPRKAKRSALLANGTQ